MLCRACGACFAADRYVAFGDVGVGPQLTVCCCCAASGIQKRRRCLCLGLRTSPERSLSSAVRHRSSRDALGPKLIGPREVFKSRVPQETPLRRSVESPGAPPVLRSRARSALGLQRSFEY